MTGEQEAIEKGRATISQASRCGKTCSCSAATPYSCDRDRPDGEKIERPVGIDRRQAHARRTFFVPMWFLNGAKDPPPETDGSHAVTSGGHKAYGQIEAVPDCDHPRLDVGYSEAPMFLRPSGSGARFAPLDSTRSPRPLGGSP